MVSLRFQTLVRPVILRFAWLLALAFFPCAVPGGVLPKPDIAAGPFEPSWESLARSYQCPEWFRDAKFGIWAVYGPQCQPEDGDWYARGMYFQGNPQYNYQVAHYGHPSKIGFKDVIHDWKAENFHPDELLAFYKKCGAKYFMAMANHHDNFDMYASKYQPWNSVAIGPQKDIIGMWAKAARKNGLRFGVSVHASHAWTWYEPSQGADKTGPLVGVPYDGKMTRADGHGLWWDGLDPQALYAQNHPTGNQKGWDWWDWDTNKGSTTPDAAYIEKFYLRTKQLWDDYHPDAVYFDDTILPLHGVTDEVGLDLVAHFYNSSIQRHGRNEAVIYTKHLDDLQRKAVVYDIERGKANDILPQPWQTDTCLGDWHYQRKIFEKHGYKTAATVIPMLADIVSKNGNLMLSVPVRGDGTIDEDERKIVSDIGAWLKVNGEAIYSTRPWKVFGEGPATRVFEKGQFDGQRDANTAPFTPQDIRFTQSKDGRNLYAIVLAFPADGMVTIKSLAAGAPLWPGAIGKARILGAGRVEKISRDGDGLHLTLPDKKPCEIAFVIKISHS